MTRGAKLLKVHPWRRPNKTQRLGKVVGSGFDHAATFDARPGLPGLPFYPILCVLVGTHRASYLILSAFSLASTSDIFLKGGVHPFVGHLAYLANLAINVCRPMAISSCRASCLSENRPSVTNASSPLSTSAGKARQQSSVLTVAPVPPRDIPEPAGKYRYCRPTCLRSSP